jgi:thiol-disulfide isomerase/thioredoxin
MKRNLLLVFAMAAVMAACGTKDVTTIKSTFPSTESAPKEVQVTIGETLDTLIAVVDGKLDATIPVNKQNFAYVIANGQPMQFVSDGSVITFDFIEKTIVSSKKDGVTSRMLAFKDWQDGFMKEYREKLGSLSGEERDAFQEESLEDYNEHLTELIQDNPDNVLALLGLGYLELDDNAKTLEILQGLSKEMQETPSVKELVFFCTAQLETAEGKMFKDFTVVQDPDKAEETTVKLSDYVGKGKYVLVDFWASWCVPCLEEAPKLKKIYEKYKGDKFEMVGVAVSEAAAESFLAARDLGMTWPQILNAQYEPASIYGFDAIPYTILFGPDGTILKRNLRSEELEKVLAEVLK